MWNPLPPNTVTPPASYPPIVTDNRKSVDLTPGYTALAGLAAGVVGARVMSKKPDSDKE
jgi:hydrogenase small subunit